MPLVQAPPRPHPALAHPAAPPALPRADLPRDTLPLGTRSRAVRSRATVPALRFVVACLVAAAAWLVPVAALFWLAT